MAAPQQTYQDPTVGYLQFLQGLGGKEGTVTGDPGAMEALRNILNLQMGQLTPEGIAGLIKEIFEQGGKAVPQIATQFGQAAGARTTNNSGIKIANANLQKELASKSMSAIMQAQAAAAQTAGVLGGLNKTETSGSTLSAMQLLPFAPAMLKKLGVDKLFNTDSATNASYDTGANTLNGLTGNVFEGGSTGYNFDSGIDFSAGGGMTDYGGGFGSDGIDIGGFDAGGSSVEFVEGFDGFDLGFKNGGLVSRKKMGSAAKKPKGYADGGRVTSVGGTPEDVIDVTGRPIRGVNYNGGNTADSLIPLLASINGVGSTDARNFNAPIDPKKSDGFGDHTNSGPAVSVPSVVGTPEENAAAIAGIVGMAVATALGVPAAVPGVAMSLAGIPNSSMSPTGKSLNFALNLISQLVSPDAVNDSTPSVGEAGMSTVGPTGAGMSTTANSSQGLTVSMDSINAPAQGIADSLGLSVGDIGGGSSGGTDGVGDAAAAGVGGGGFKKGGKINGPGTETSDSITIEVSDEEYVLNAEATKMFLPVIEVMNAIGLQQRNGGMNGTR